MLAAWRRRTRGEHRLPSVAAITLAIVLQLLLPDRLSLHPRWLLPGVEIALLVVLILGNPVRLVRESTRFFDWAVAPAHTPTAAAAPTAGDHLRTGRPGPAPRRHDPAPAQRPTRPLTRRPSRAAPPRLRACPAPTSLRTDSRGDRTRTWAQLDERAARPAGHVASLELRAVAPPPRGTWEGTITRTRVTCSGRSLEETSPHRAWRARPAARPSPATSAARPAGSRFREVLATCRPGIGAYCSCGSPSDRPVRTRRSVATPSRRSQTGT